MNIQEAKEEIANTLKAYGKRNPDGSPRIPVEKQRPLLLIGPPGIGKTAIMKQIAGELNCGLVAYSMTHHTRQSAIGLPFISQKEYGGKTRSVTEYTMSEIVASIYDYMQETGHRGGILFLDEINCVSETLSPVMLQLLQNKTFGNTPLPEGWVIVAAGNPPEYNKSVRELDMVTMDRVKNMEIEADLPVWMDYARENRVHPAIRSYLSIYPDHFYRITDTVGGQLFVTARGWEDLSLMLCAYEEDGIAVKPDWFLQYLQDDEIARSFGLYYDLYRHYGAQPRDYSPEKLAAAGATEFLTIAAMLFHPIEQGAKELCEKKKLLGRKKALAALLPNFGADPEQQARSFFAKRRTALAQQEESSFLPISELLTEKKALTALEDRIQEWLKLPRETRPGFAVFEDDAEDAQHRENTEKCRILSDEIEKAYAVLSAAEAGRSALFYFTADLAASAECREVLKECPSQAFDRWEKTLKEE